MQSRRNFLKGIAMTASALALKVNTAQSEEPKKEVTIFDVNQRYDGERPEWMHVGQTDEKTFNRSPNPKNIFESLHTISEITGDPKDRLRLKSTGNLHYIEHLGKDVYKNKGLGERITTLEIHHEGRGENPKKIPQLSNQFHYGQNHNRPFFHEQVIRFGIDKKGNRSIAVYDQADQKIYLFMKKK